MDYFFIDIDGTITDNNPDKKYSAEKLVWGNPVLGVIRDVMVEEGWSPEEAKSKIEEYAHTIIWWDYPDFIAEFNLPVGKTWARIYDWHYQYKIFYSDTVELIKALNKKKKKLFIVSNNPVVGCLLNLKVAGLGEITGSRYFKRILGANILRGQKSQRELWKKAIAQIGAEPEEIVNIGDNEREDGDIPVSAGIGTAVIIKRDITERIRREGRKVFIQKPADCLHFLLT